MHPETGSSSRPTRLSTYTQQFMANPVKKIQLFLPEDIAVHPNSIKFKPPLGGFHKQRTDEKRKTNTANTPPKCVRQIFDGTQLTMTKNENTAADAEKKAYRRRIQSAKPRLISDKTNDPETEASQLTKTRNVKHSRPFSAVEPRSEARWNYSYFCRLKSSSSECSVSNSSCVDNNNSKLFEPCVFGYKSQAYISGSRESEAEKAELRTGNNNRLHVSAITKPLNDNDNTSLSELIDFEDSEEENNIEEDDSVPSTLKPLLPWATPNISQDVIGIDPATCLIFLPSLMTCAESLPCVPPPLNPNEDLPHQGEVKPCKSSEKTKKYDHPWKPLPIEEFQCNHKTKRVQETKVTTTESPRQIKVYNIDGILLHKSGCGVRSEEVVRKEIQELEDLMQGIGTLNGCSVVVQYQAEVNILKNMLRRTMRRVEEIERREEEKNKSAEPPDHFGLRTFYKNHDEIMEQLRVQHFLCLQELAVLTGDLGMNTAREHFENHANHETKNDNEL